MAITLLLMNRAGQGYVQLSEGTVQFLTPPYQTTININVDTAELQRKPPSGFVQPSEDESQSESITDVAIMLTKVASLPRVDWQSRKVARAMVATFPIQWVRTCLDHIEKVYLNDGDHQYKRASIALNILFSAPSLKADQSLLNRAIKLRVRLLERKAVSPQSEGPFGSVRQKIRRNNRGLEIPAAANVNGLFEYPVNQNSKKAQRK